MNTKLLQKVKQHILENPARLRMNNWVTNAKIIAGDGTLTTINNNEFCFLGGGWGEPDTQPIPDCGTVGCIAGWTVIIGDNIEPTELGTISGITERAKELLRISSDQAEELFYVDDWNISDETAYRKAKTQEARAKIVGRVIDSFSKKYAMKRSRAASK